MKRENAIGCSAGSRFGALILGMVLGSSTLLGQMPGKWVGTTSQGGNMEFQVNLDGVASFRSALLATCESGGQHPITVGAGGLPVPIIDGSFDWEVPPREFGGIAFEFAGTFSSDTEAAGTLTFLLPTFRILEQDFTCQICRDDVEWTATWESPGALPGGLDPHPSRGDRVTTYSDGELSVQVVSKAPASKQDGSEP